MTQVAAVLLYKGITFQAKANGNFAGALFQPIYAPFWLLVGQVLLRWYCT